ncbi:MAG: MATE family efflux transporter [Clostridiales bacterium]|nr:MATE family efflux transporter [Clostridiales bacterium]
MDQKKGFAGKLIKIILPITIQNFMFSLVPISDAMMLVYLDQDQMSAVSLAAQAMFVLNIFLYAIVSGMSLFAAQYWGKGDIRSFEKMVGYSLKLSFPILLVFFGLGMFNPMGVMRIYTNDPVIIAHGMKYLRFVAFAYIFTGLAQIFGNVLKNSGLVIWSTVISVAMVISNVLLNAVFIYGLLGAPKLESRGAALATTISSAIGCISALILILVKKTIKIRIKDILKTDLDMRKDFSKYSGPLLFNNISWGIGFTMISVIIGHLNSDVVAANAIAAVVKDLVSCFCFALAAGGSIVVGNELGAGDLKHGKEYGDKIFKISIISGIILGLLTAASTPVVLRIVGLTPKAEYYLMWMLIMCSYYILGRSINSVVISGILAAGGDTKFGMICDTVTMWAFIVPVGALLAFVVKIPVVWVCFFLYLDEMVKIPVVYWYYKRYRWVKNIVNKEDA